MAKSTKYGVSIILVAASLISLLLLNTNFTSKDSAATGFGDVVGRVAAPAAGIKHELVTRATQLAVPFGNKAAFRPIIAQAAPNAFLKRDLSW